MRRDRPRASSFSRSRPTSCSAGRRRGAAGGTPTSRKYLDLPTLGRLTGRGNTANVEVLLGARPDVIVDYGTINPTYVSLADRVQEQTRIPYLLLDGAFDRIPAIAAS